MSVCVCVCVCVCVFPSVLHALLGQGQVRFCHKIAEMFFRTEKISTVGWNSKQQLYIFHSFGALN